MGQKKAKPEQVTPQPQKKAKPKKQNKVLGLALAFAAGLLVCAAVTVGVLFAKGIIQLPEKKILDEGEPYADYKMSDYITLGDYKDLTVEVSAADETSQFEGYFSEAQLVKDDVSKTKVENGDTVLLDFEGEGKGLSADVLASMKAKYFQLEIGSGSFIPGFEEQIVGKPRGEAFDVNVTFPADYQEASLAGKPITFHCLVRAFGSVETIDAGDVTDNAVAQLTQGQYLTIEQLKSFIHYSLARNAAFEKAFGNASVKKIPQKEKQLQLASLDDAAVQSGQTRQAFMEANNYTEEDIDDYLKYELFVFAVAQQENLKVSDSDLKEYLDPQRGGDATVTDDDLYAQMGGKGRVIRNLMFEKVMDFVIENAKDAPTKPAQAE